MKLSELTTGQAADVMIQITPLIANIAGDEKAVNAIGRAADVTELNVNGLRIVRAERWASFVNVLLADHRADVFGILAAVNMSTPKKIEAQKITETFKQIKELMEDEELVDFLASFVPSAKTAQSAPSANAPDTLPQEG